MTEEGAKHSQGHKLWNEEKQCDWPCNMTVIQKSPPCPNQCGTKGCTSYQVTTKLDVKDLVFVWVYGAPSAGKTTQCQKIAAKYGLTVLSPGALIKRERDAQTKNSRCLKNCLERGELAPNDMVIGLLKKEIDNFKGSTKGFIIDNFPREERQGLLFEEVIAPVNGFIFLDVPRQVIEQRHIPKAAISQKRWPTERREDNCVTGKLHVHIFYLHHKNIIDQYPHRIYPIDVGTKPADAVFREVEIVMNKIIAKKDKEVAARKAFEAYWEAQKPKEPIVSKVPL